MGRADRGGRRARHDGETDPFLQTANAEAFLRALHLQLAIAPIARIRPDLLLVLMSALRSTNPSYLT